MENISNEESAMSRRQDFDISGPPSSRPEASMEFEVVDDGTVKMTLINGVQAAQTSPVHVGHVYNEVRVDQVPCASFSGELVENHTEREVPGDRDRHVAGRRVSCHSIMQSQAHESKTHITPSDVDSHRYISLPDIEHHGVKLGLTRIPHPTKLCRQCQTSIKYLRIFTVGLGLSLSILV